MTSISYSISVNNEKQIFDLIQLLKNNINLLQDEICVVADISKTDNSELILELKKDNDIKLSYFYFENNFSDLKNFKNSNCTKDFIFDIDADEKPTIDLLKNIHSLLDANSHIDLFFISRVNTVVGLQEEHKKMFNYYPDQNGYINFPDYQGRIYKNSPNIGWNGVIHEKIIGNKNHGVLPADPNLSLIHEKTVEKELYSYYNIFNRK